MSCKLLRLSIKEGLVQVLYEEAQGEGMMGWRRGHCGMLGTWERTVQGGRPQLVGEEV